MTTFDLKEVRIYPLRFWRRVEKFLEEPGDDAAYRQDMALIASSYGKDDELDAQGRLTLPVELRKELGLEKDESRLRWFKDHWKLVSSQEHGRQLGGATDNLGHKVGVLTAKGL